MNLRSQAASDFRAILEDDAAGFGWSIVVTSPAGVAVSMRGYSADVGLVIDPETGVAVIGRRASVALSIASLREAGLGIPGGVADSSQRPWRIQFNDTEGNTFSFRVVSSMPDQTIGSVTCLLEAYQ